MNDPEGEILYNPWVCSVLGSVSVGLCGVLPVFLLPSDKGENLHKIGQGETLNLLLSFAVGGLLGDVFLHLLPEACNYLHTTGSNGHGGYIRVGAWILCGIITFVIIERLIGESTEDETKEIEGNNNVGKGGDDYGCSITDNKSSKNIPNGKPIIYPGKPKKKGNAVSEECKKKAFGYMNLLANSIDNFAHGLSVAGSFLLSYRIGVLTTLAILIHEIPHEIGDFAILVRAGFCKWQAARAQLCTATLGLLGALAALYADNSAKLGERTWWIVPFTAGGFLNVALVSVLPDLMRECDPWRSARQMLALLAGVAVMGCLSSLCHHHM